MDGLPKASGRVSCQPSTAFWLKAPLWASGFDQTPQTVSAVATRNSVLSAVSENYTNEFVVGQTGQFFSLRQVP